MRPCASRGRLLHLPSPSVDPPVNYFLLIPVYARQAKCCCLSLYACVRAFTRRRTDRRICACGCARTQPDVIMLVYVFRLLETPTERLQNSLHTSSAAQRVRTRNTVFEFSDAASNTTRAHSCASPSHHRPSKSHYYYYCCWYCYCY